MVEDEERLLKHDPEYATPTSTSYFEARHHAATKRWLHVSFAVNALLSLLMGALWIRYRTVVDIIDARRRVEIYSPANHVTEYHQVVFDGKTAPDGTSYRGATDEINKRWEDLYNEFGISQISAESNAKLPNATLPNHNDPSKYIVGLDVFHQLHCVNLFRKLVYPSVFPEIQVGGGDEDAVDHLEHCYDQLRQSIMCHSDLATIYWEWMPERNRAYGNTRTTHTCRNFEKVKQWALEHQMVGEMDLNIFVEGAPIRHLAQDDMHH